MATGGPAGAAVGGVPSGAVAAAGAGGRGGTGGTHGGTIGTLPGDPLLELDVPILNPRFERFLYRGADGRIIPLPEHCS